MSTVNLILVRHGETTWNVVGKYQGQTDVPLSEVGLKQAKTLAKFFPAAEVDAVYASDLSRALVTAECIGEKFSRPVQMETAFRELDFGEWEGLNYEEIVSRWPTAMDNFLQHPEKPVIPGGESFTQLQERVMGRLGEIIAAHPGQTVVIVAHGAVLRTVLASFMQMPLQYVWRLRQYNTAVSIVRVSDGFPTVEVMNSTAHLIFAS